MVAKRGESSRHVLGWAGLPKYVHHPELDYGGWRDFLPGIEPLLAQDARPSGADEGRLFRAMHYCAYRAWMARGKQCVVTARAADWIARRERIRDHLILVNLGLCYDMLRRNRFTNVDEDELFSEAQRALCDAVEAYDPWRGYRFSTYACNAIYRGFLRLSKMETRRARFVTYGFEPRLDRGRLDPDLHNFDERVYSDRLNGAIRKNDADLTHQERHIIERRFPDHGGRKRDTLQRIGNDLSISKERVRQIQMNALTKLHNAITAEPVLS
jgi:RNA polymerase primary sigma factor